MGAEMTEAAYVYDPWLSVYTEAGQKYFIFSMKIHPRIPKPMRTAFRKQCRVKGLNPGKAHEWWQR